METAGEKSTAKSDAALLDIRKALERNRPALQRLPPKLNAWVQATVAKHERAKFKRFLLTVEHRGDVDLRKAARRVGVSKELLDKWTNTAEISKCVNHFLSNGRKRRARLVLGWVKFHLKTGPLTLKVPLTADGEIPPDAIDYGNTLPLAKQATMAFKWPRLFRAYVEMALMIREVGGLSSAKQFFIDLGRCLSHGTRGTRGIKPGLWDKLDMDVADIILSHDPPMSDKDAVHELQNRGHLLGGHLPILEIRLRKRKHRLIHDAHAFLKAPLVNA